MTRTKTARVLKDIVLADEFYEEGSLLKMKAKILLERDKQKLFDFERKNSYDNYVTGSHSKMKLEGLVAQLHLEYIYEEIEVDRTFV